MSDTGEHRTIVMHRRHGATTVATPTVGMRLGKYRLCLELASGGMSTVFLARVQDGVGRHRFVALKCLKPRLAEEAGFADMFLDEARVSSLIHHPNVCDVVDFRVQGGVSYMAMELLEGQTLAAVLHRLGAAGDAWPAARIAAVVARIVADAAEGLHCAHELTDLRGEPLHVVHRDVSPENVFLTYDGNVKIMDFGVALTSQQRHHTEPGTFKGKYSYVAPEILRGAKPDRRVDVWGLGMIAWELLAGRRLFEVENEIDVLRAVIDTEIPRPSQVRPGIPEALDEVVMRALERDPARRYPTARELGRKLTCVLAEQRMAVGLAETSELVAELFPNGRACARQLRDTVERMEAAAMSDDTGEHPTVAGPLSAPAPSTRAIPTPRIGLVTRRALRMPRRRVDPGWLAVFSPLVAAAAVVAALAVYASQRDAAPPSAGPAAAPAPVIDARPARTRTRAAPATCTPDPLGDRLEVELQPVQSPTGEIVFRMKPIER